MRRYSYEECRIGLRESFSVVITEKMMEGFRELSGDLNPLHNDEKFAIEKGFKERVCYGMLTASFLSRLAGMYLPGELCLIQETDIRFVKPVYIGDCLNVTGEIAERNDTFKQLVLKVVLYNQNDEKVLRGKMKVAVMEG